MKRSLVIGMMFSGALAAALLLGHFPRKKPRVLGVALPARVVRGGSASDRLSDGELDAMTAAGGGDSHSMAVDELVGLAKRHQPLADGDMRTLLSFISGAQPEELSDAEWEERVNVVLNALRLQENDVPGLTDFLLATAERHQSRILRLYAMQHLALWHHQEPSAEKRREIVSLLERMAEEPGAETAGAAVMFLNDLGAGERGDDMDHKQESLSRVALRLAEDPSAKQDVRISALHTCSERRMAEALPVARRIAADSSLVTPLRKAAIHCIGGLGTKDDISLLVALEKQNATLRPATGPAIRSLDR